MDRLLIRFTINHAETDTTTPVRAHIIQRFAFLTLSSSPPETKYITPAIIKVMTAITEVYFIISPIIFPITRIALLFEVLTFAISVPTHPGSPAQLISGRPHPPLEEVVKKLEKLRADTSWKELKMRESPRRKRIKSLYFINNEN